MQQNVKVIAGSILLAALIIAGAIMYTPGTTPTYQAQVAPVAQKAVVGVDDDYVLGDADAPVSVIVFGDYQCPFCKKAADTAEKQIRDEYVAAGKVKIAFRDYPLDSIHPFARPAAEAAQCAGAQGKYWEYHDALFERQSQLPTIDYVGLASELKLDTKAFAGCISAKTYASEVQKDQEAGVALGIDGTPATFINGVLIPGAYPYEAYKQEIEKALAGK
jgi:protein-disulfide isomerase